MDFTLLMKPIIYFKRLHIKERNCIEGSETVNVVLLLYCRIVQIIESSVRISSANCCYDELGSLPFLFSSQLLVQFGHVVVPLGLVTGSRLWRSQVVLLPEGLDVELAAAVAGAVGEHGLGARQGPWLLVDQPHVPVEAWGGGRGMSADSVRAGQIQKALF